MAQVIWTVEAQRWLREIFDYIAADNPDAAVRVIDELQEAARSTRGSVNAIGTSWRARSRPDPELGRYGHERAGEIVSGRFILSDSFVLRLSFIMVLCQEVSGNGWALRSGA